MDALVQVHPALLQVMQHPAICNDQQSIATLLCTSKQFTRAVKDRCSGLIQLVCRFDSLQQAQGLAKWLAANGSLARSLEIGPLNPSIQIGSRRDQATAAIAQALGRAGSSQQGLKLQHMVLNEVSNDPALLQQLTHSSQLTALTVLLPRVKDTTTSAGSTALLVPALRGLTTLRKLTLHCRWHRHTANPDAVIPALTSLSNMSFLSIDEPKQLTDLQLLPANLQHLRLTVGQHITGVSQRPALQLGHLTALTAISYARPSSIPEVFCDSYNRPYPRFESAFLQLCHSMPSFISLQQGDQLPLTLRELTVSSIRSGFLQQGQLQRLRKLVLTGAKNIPPAVLQAIPQHCHQLTSLQLRYEDVSCLDMAALSFPALPLTDLWISSAFATRDFLHHLSSTSKTLTLLTLEADIASADTAQLAATIKQLQKLQQLSVNSSIVMGSAEVQDTYNSDEAGDSRSAAQHAAQADMLDCHVLAVVASLQHLRRFAFVATGDTLSQRSYAGLAAATQLTALRLRQCGLEDRTVGVLTRSLTGLRVLDIAQNEFITSRVLPVIARGLKQLTYLDVCETLINEVDVHSIPQLSVLKMGSLLPKATARGWSGVVMDLDE